MRVPIDQARLVAAKYDITVTNALYSSLLGLVRNYIQGLLPHDFFKTVYIRNSVAAVTTANDDDMSRLLNIRPNLSINMEYEPQQASFNGDSHLFGNMLVHREAHLNRHAYNRIVWDSNERVYITAMTARAKHSFEIIMQMNTEMQALNVYGNLRARLGVERPYFLNNRLLEVPIPTSLLGKLAEVKGYDLRNKEKLLEFNALLDSISDGRITYKAHPASGKFLYFYKFRTNLLMKMESIDTVERELEGKAQMHASVRFKLSMEYDNHLNYLLESYKNLPDPPVSEYLIEDTSIGGTISWTLGLTVSEQLADGKKCAFKIDITTELNTATEEIELSGVLPTTLNKFITAKSADYTTSEAMKPFVELYVIQDQTQLQLGIDYEVDWLTKKVTLINPRLNYDYHLFLYVNSTELNKFNDALLPPNNI